MGRKVPRVQGELQLQPWQRSRAISLTSSITFCLRQCTTHQGRARVCFCAVPPCCSWMLHNVQLSNLVPHCTLSAFCCSPANQRLLSPSTLTVCAHGCASFCMLCSALAVCQHRLQCLHHSHHLDNHRHCHSHQAGGLCIRHDWQQQPQRTPVVCAVDRRNQHHRQRDHSVLRPSTGSMPQLWLRATGRSQGAVWEGCGDSHFALHGP